MRITERQLRKIIREEVGGLTEGRGTKPPEQIRRELSMVALQLQEIIRSLGPDQRKALGELRLALGKIYDAEDLI